MSTNAAVRDAWKTQVFDNFPHVPSFQYPLSQASQEQVKRGIKSNQVNFFEYLVQSTETPQMTQVNRLDFRVTVRRTIEQDVKGANYATMLDDFRTLTDYVNDNLGVHWNQTVTLSTEPQVNNDLNIEDYEYDGRPCWRAQLIFTAIKFVNA